MTSEKVSLREAQWDERDLSGIWELCRRLFENYRTLSEDYYAKATSAIDLDRIDLLGLRRAGRLCRDGLADAGHGWAVHRPRHRAARI